MSVGFFVDCPKISFWSVLSLSCCCLFKIYTSYVISKCKSVKVINSPWFLVPHFYLLSVQSYKRLKLRAFQDDYSAEPMEDNFLSSNSILSRTSLCPYFVSWKIYLFTSKKNYLYEQRRNDYSISHNIFAIAAWKKCILWN